MARKNIKIAGGVLNIRLHPHPARRYADFIEDLYALKMPAKLRGDRHAMISLLNRSESEKGIFSGVITTFVKIEFDGSWFSTSEMKEATQEEVSQVHIPAHIHPNSASFYFVFDSEDHKFYFQTYSAGKTLSHKSVYELIQHLSIEPSIRKKYGDVKIDIVQSKEGLDYVFKMDRIKEVKIRITKPNADIFNDNFEEDIESHLAETGSRSLTFTYEAERGGSIVPSDEMREVGNVALSNGVVEVNGRDASGAVRRSTAEHPEVLQDKYNPEELPEASAFRRLIANRLRRVLG